MKLVRHRVNRIDELDKLPPGIGAEIDLRSRDGNIVLTHDVLAAGATADSFDRFAERWKAGPRGTLILNPKEDGLEAPAIALLARLGIEDYFFLDLSLPTTVRLAVREGFRKIALRVSEYEPPEAALRLAGKVEWVWIDSFGGEPIDVSVLERLRRDFKTCLVSPELQSFPVAKIPRFLPLVPHLDAVCTKRPDLWSGSPAP